MSSDAYHMTYRRKMAGAALAMVNAIRDAGIERPDRLRQRPRHLTPAGDKAEAQAVKSVPVMRRAAYW